MLTDEKRVAFMRQALADGFPLTQQEASALLSDRAELVAEVERLKRDLKSAQDWGQQKDRLQLAAERANVRCKAEVERLRAVVEAAKEMSAACPMTWTPREAADE